jgi:hypothetical protein
LKRALVFAAALALAGCGSKKADKHDDKAPPAGSVVAMAGSGSAAMAGSATMAGSAGSAAAGSAVDVPTEEDFEASAKTDITTSNVDSKVKAIEDQLGQQ